MSEVSGPAPSFFHVGAFVVDTAARCLRRDGVEVHLRDQSYRVLLLLVESRDRIVPHDEILDRVWGDVAVGRDSVVQCIADVRRALGDDPRNPTFVRTVPRRGYRWVAEVEEVPASPPRARYVSSETVTTILEVEEEIVDDRLSPRSAGEGARVRRPFPVKAAILGAVAAGVALLAHSLRDRPSRTALPLEAGRTAVVVVPFENLAEVEAFDWLERGAAEMLVTGLARSDALTVPSLQHVGEVLGSGAEQPATSFVDVLAHAREQGVDAVVSGSFSVLDEGLRIDARIHDPARETILATEGLVVEESGRLLSTIDRLSTRLVARLGSEIGEKLALAEGLTRDLEAYRAYALALDAAHAYRVADARDLFLEALARDPDFVMARARLGYLEAMVSWFPERGRPHLEDAFRSRNRLTDRDRRLLVAWHALARSDFDRAIDAYTELLDRYPAEGEAYWRLGNLLRGEERSLEAVEVLERGLTIFPRSGEILNVLGMVHADRHELDRAIEVHRAYVANDPREANAYDSLGMTLDRAGRYEEALAAFDRALELEPDFEMAAWHRRVVLSRTGQRDQLRRFLEEAARTSAPDDPHLAHGLDRLGWIQFREGDEEGFLRTAAALEDAPDPPAVSLVRTLAAARRGTTFEVSDQALPAHGRRTSLHTARWARGVLALAEGDVERGLAELRRMRKHRSPLGELWMDDELARALIRLGRFTEAVDEIDRILRLVPRYPGARYLLGVCHQALGDSAAARRELEAFLTEWSNADPDLPEIIDARRRLADLRA